MAKTRSSAPKAPDLASRLLDWYAKQGRDLPWREHQGRAPSPYHTWLSEIMLQQTGVSTVIPYYRRFANRWPDVRALAAASEEEVLSEWAGLGYYSRGRNLLKCAQAVVERFDGVFPSEIDALKSLPGIGDYTSNAIRAIAFDKPANVVDGNVERVVSRIFAFDQPINLPKNKQALKELAATLAPQKQAGDYAQAIMDLGATICTPRNPKCDLCPWQKNCRAFAKGLTDVLPASIKRAKIPERQAVSYLLQDKQGRIWLRQRPNEGLLGGLWEFPSTDWSRNGIAADQQPHPCPGQDFTALNKPVIHVFTHFRLRMMVQICARPAISAPQGAGQWFAPDALPALSTLTKKILEAGAPFLPS